MIRWCKSRSAFVSLSLFFSHTHTQCLSSVTHMNNPVGKNNQIWICKLVAIWQLQRPNRGSHSGHGRRVESGWFWCDDWTKRQAFAFWLVTLIVHHRHHPRHALSTGSKGNCLGCTHTQLGLAQPNFTIVRFVWRHLSTCTRHRVTRLYFSWLN